MNFISAISIIISSICIQGNLANFANCVDPAISGLFLTNDTYQAGEINYACCKRGLFPVEITNANFLHAANLAFSCAGPRSKSWIGYWYDSIYDDNLVLTTGNQNGGAAINVPSGSPFLPVMCQDLPTAQFGPSVCLNLTISSSSSVSATATTAISSSTPVISSSATGN